VNEPVSAREALIIEALGEAVNLIDSLERMTARTQEVGREIARANAGLQDSLGAFEARITALTEKSKVVAVKHILARTDEAARRTVDEQTRAMAQTAQALFKTEIDPSLRRLAAPLRQLVEQLDRPWEQWLTHAATASVTFTITLAVSVWAFGR